MPGEPDWAFATNRQLLAQTKAALVSTGMRVHDIELARITDDIDVQDYLPEIEIAAEMGARAVLSSIWTAKRDVYVRKFAKLCDIAKPFGMTVDLEYVAISPVHTLAGVVDVLQEVERECPDGAADCLYAGASGAAPPDAIAARMWDFIHTVEETTARKPMVYTFGSYFAANGIDTTGLASYPLFLAAPSSLACVSVPAPWSAAAAWQYSWTGRVSGIEPPVDRDRIVGAMADWVDLSATLPPSQGASAGEPPPRPTSTPSPSTTAPLSPPVPTATMTSPSPSPPVPTATMTSPSPAIATATMTSPSPPIPAVAMTSPPVSTATPILPSATRPDSGDAAGPRQSAGCGVGGAGMMANAPHLWSALACLAFVGGVGLVVRKRRLPFATGAC